MTKPKITITDKSIKPIINAALELFSPATELLGWAGDAIRVHRARSALKCFKRTKELASESGLTLKAPPAKFLAQYIENSSLEDSNDAELIEWWARLLVDAGSNFDHKHTFYTNVLKQISAIELELLECLVRNGRGNYRLQLTTEAEFSHEFNTPGDKLKLSSKLTKKASEKSIKTIREEFEEPGVLLLDLFIDDATSNSVQELHPDYSEDELPSWQMLQSLQLVRLVFRRYTFGQVDYRIRLAVLTELGAKFYFSCHDTALPNKMSAEIRFTRKHGPPPSST